MKRKFLVGAAAIGLLAATIALGPKTFAATANSADMLISNSFTSTSKTYSSTSKKTITSTFYHNNALKNKKLLKGLDVSKWQSKNSYTTTSINWSKAHDDGIDFAFVRVGYTSTSDGSHHADTSANSQITSALANDVSVGVYYFSQALTVAEAKSEAKYTLSLLEKNGWDVTLPVVFDYEFNKRLTSGKLSKSTMTKICAAYCDVIADAGYTPAIYANYSMFNNYLNTSTLAKSYKIWLARYHKTTTSYYLASQSKIPYSDIAYPYEFWQFTSSGRVSGYSGNLDVNYWYFDRNVNTNNLASSNETNDSVKLTWSRSSGAKDFYIYRYNEDTQSYKRIGSTSKTYYTDDDLKAGETYKYKVRCYWTIGGTKYYGNYSDVITTATKPGKVSGVDVSTRNANSLTLSWDETEGATGYRIYKYDEDSESYSKIATTEDNSYKVSGLTSASEYAFKVRAYKTINDDTLLGSYSDKFDTVTRPKKVTSLKVTSPKKNTAKITFNKVYRTAAVNVYRYDTTKKKFVRIKSITNGSTTYTDSNVKSGKTYRYKVRSYFVYNDTTIWSYYSSEYKIKVK
ncbi:MAG: fibronectin type III domain-containing protein [Lachnospiraceae bacterium]|nr:fibronectin type III domain-containing protein [Lachnospiraceae bacterium]